MSRHSSLAASSMSGAALLLSASSAIAQVDDAAAADFQKMIEAHRNLPAVVVKCDLTITLEQDGSTASSEEVEATFTHRKGGNGLIEVRGYTVHIAGTEIQAVHESNEDEYYSLKDAGEDIHSALVWECFGSFERMPFPHIAIFWGVEDPAELYMQFYADTPEQVPTGVVDRVLDGKTVRTIEFTGPAGKMEINLDPRTMLISSIRHRIESSPFLPEGVVRTNEYACEYELPESIEESRLAFAQGDRIRTESMTSLDTTAALAGAAGDDGAIGAGGLKGQPAPAFLLQTAEGEMIDLAKLRGQVVIIDFWATWCPPCRVGLPELHRVAAWAEEKGLPVTVLTINIHDESGDTHEEKKETAVAFWDQSGHSLPILLDYEGEAQFAYGVSGIPATFVIGPEGVVASVHEGVDMDNPAGYGEALRQEIIRLLEQ